jgi:hypothetical protein
MQAPTLIQAATVGGFSNDFDIVQAPPFDYFIMDPSLTYGEPGIVQAGVTEVFNLGGIWLDSLYLDHINFACSIFGAQVFNQDTAYNT